MDTLGIDHGEGYRLSVGSDDEITGDTAIDVKTVTQGYDYDTESVPFETEYVDDNTILKGEEEVAVAGSEGVKTYTYLCTYVNGIEESRELVGTDITTQPVNKVIHKGTKVYTPPAPTPAPQTNTPTPSTTYTGAPESYLYYVDVRATCYSIVGTTATGLPTGNNVMAVDPNVIPLGSECVVIGELGDYGHRIAADVGRGIQGNIIDIWVPEGSGFGWQNARVYVLG